VNKVEVLQLIAAARMLWPSWRDAPSTQEEASLMGDTWLAVLDDIPNDLAYAALTMLSAEGREFVPPAGVVRREAIMLRARSTGDLPPGADEAWREVRQAIERGAGADWSHPCIGETVAAIGWYELRTSANQDSLRAHFMKFYGEATERHHRDLVLSDSMVRAISQASLQVLVDADVLTIRNSGGPVSEIPRHIRCE
jgi:hypothetical protein